jgi:predicted DNA-binding protein (UPF0251 family)
MNRSNGYGFIGKGAIPGNLLTHRVAWMLTNGDIPDGAWVCHRCDNGACCNPAHLFLGSPLTNSIDMHKKGRAPRGERHWSKLHPEMRLRGMRNGNSRITDDDVRAIRRLHATRTLSQANIASQFGVKQHVVWSIVNHRTWNHVTD